MTLQLTFITSRDGFMEVPTSVQCTPRSMDHVRVVCNCDDVLILAFHAAFENDSSPLNDTHQSYQHVQNAKDFHQPIDIVFPQKTGS